MLTSVIPSGQPVSGYAPAILSENSSGAGLPHNYNHRDSNYSEFLQPCSLLPLGFAILLAMPQSTLSYTDFSARARLLSYPLASQIYEPMQEKIRYLTREEQRVFRTALLLSARSIHKAKRPSR